MTLTPTAPVHQAQNQSDIQAKSQTEAPTTKVTRASELRAGSGNGQHCNYAHIISILTET